MWLVGSWFPARIMESLAVRILVLTIDSQSIHFLESSHEKNVLIIKHYYNFF